MTKPESVQRRVSQAAMAAILAIVAAATAVTMLAQPVPYGWLGLTLEWQHPPGRNELTIASVDADSPAARSGLAAGDRIVGFGSLDDRIALTLEAKDNWLSANRVVTIAVARGTGVRTTQVRLQGVRRHRGPPWIIDLRLFVYLLGVLLAGALVAFRPTVVTWSFAAFVILFLSPNIWYWQCIGVYGSPKVLFAWILFSYLALSAGSVALIVFAARFPDGASFPRFYRVVEHISILFLVFVGAAFVQYQAAQVYGWPTLNYDTLANLQSFVPALVAIALLTLTLLRSRGDQRIPLAWAIAGPALCTLFLVVDIWLTAIASLPVVYPASAGLLSSIAPFTMMYAVLRYRVIDIGLGLGRSYAQAVARSGRTAREPREARRLLARRAAQLFSAEIPLHELYEQLAALLASFVNAQSILVAIRNGEGARLDYVYEDGTGGRPDDVPISAQSTTGCVFAGGGPRLLRNAQEWPSGSRVVSVGGRDTRDPESAIFVPVEFGGAVVGVLSVQSLESGAYDEEDLALLEGCAVYLGPRMAGSTAALTQRAAFDEAVAREWQRASQTGAAVGLLLIDVDLFRSFNDLYGHAAGDTCLLQIAGAVASSLHGADHVLARYDGDRFAVMLSGADAARAESRAAAARSAVRSLHIAHQGSSLGYVTVSTGASLRVPAAGTDWRTLIEHAEGRIQDATSSREARVQIVARHNLPASQNTFVGRKTEIQTIAAALEANRLVTIAGPGGSGKTRTALEVARLELDGYADGIWFVDLANVTSDAVVQTVAAALGLESLDATVNHIVEDLRGKQLLLVFDNCERAIGSCARLASALLTGTDRVRILATSREPLAVRGEETVDLPPLSADDAVRLFLERTGRTQSVDADTVEGIVAKLDRMPMAIELAAARSASLPPKELLATLSDSLSEASPRALFDWSYQLLTQKEQIVLRRLAVFSGGWTLDAATALCGDDTLTATAIAEALESLLAKSLVLRARRDASSRFRFLETTRQYAREALERQGEMEQMLDRHERWAADRAALMTERKRALPYGEWLLLQSDEFENYCSALRRAIAAERGDRAAAMLRSLVGLLVESPALRELYDLVRALLQRETLSEADAAAFWQALAELSRHGRPAESLDAARRSADLFRRCGDAYGEAYAIWFLAGAELRVNGTIDRSTQERIETALATARRLRDRHLTVGLLRQVARINSESGRLDRAREALAEASEIVDRSDVAMLAALIGSSADEEFRSKNLDGAIALWNQAASLADEVRPSYAALCFLNIGTSETMRGNFAAARDMLERGLLRARTARHAFGIARSFESFAQLSKENGNLESAARFAGFAASLFDRAPCRSPAEQRRFAEMVAELKSALGSAAFEGEWSSGRTLELDAAARLAASL